jgi:hypothetical protein
MFTLAYRLAEIRYIYRSGHWLYISSMSLFTVDATWSRGSGGGTDTAKDLSPRVTVIFLALAVDVKGRGQARERAAPVVLQSSWSIPLEGGV